MVKDLLEQKLKEAEKRVKKAQRKLMESEEAVEKKKKELEVLQKASCRIYVPNWLIETNGIGPLEGFMSEGSLKKKLSPEYLSDPKRSGNVAYYNITQTDKYKRNWEELYSQLPTENNLLIVKRVKENSDFERVVKIICEKNKEISDKLLEKMHPRIYSYLSVEPFLFFMVYGRIQCRNGIAYVGGNHHSTWGLYTDVDWENYINQDHNDVPYPSHLYDGKSYRWERVGLSSYSMILLKARSSEELNKLEKEVNWTFSSFKIN